MLTRSKLEALVWKHTHKDFRGKDDDGAKSILIFRTGIGTCREYLTSLSDEDLWSKVPSAVRVVHGK